MLLSKQYRGAFMAFHKTKMRIVLVWLFGIACSGHFIIPLPVRAQQNSSTHYFPETGKSVKGNFLQYWQTHGGLAQQGYPISEEFTEVSDLNGKPYNVQYFERAVFERHPENQPPYDVLLSQLGTYRFRTKYQDQATESHWLDLGTINGKLRYPSSGVPPMDVYLVEVGGSRYYIGHNTGLEDPVIRGTAFTISGIAPGKYYLYAYLTEPNTMGADNFALAYTEGALCEIDPNYNCNDHSLIPVDIRPGANVGDLPVADISVPVRNVPRLSLTGACETFKETGRTMCGTFLTYWHAHGGLAQQGYPISDEIQEVSDLDSKEYTMQYFERAVFEKHPEFGPTNYVQLSQLGTFRWRDKYDHP